MYTTFSGGRQANINNFVTGMSPACVDDTDYACLSLDDVHSWDAVGIWTNQVTLQR